MMGGKIMATKRKSKSYSKQYDYRVDKLGNAIDSGKVSEPFVKFEGSYNVAGSLDHATVDGFGPAQVTKSNSGNKNEYVVKAKGPANVLDMLRGAYDGALTVTLSFSHDFYTTPRTVKAKVTDKKRKSVTWKTAIHEEAQGPG